MVECKPGTVESIHFKQSKTLDCTRTVIQVWLDDKEGTCSSPETKRPGAIPLQYHIPWATTVANAQSSSSSAA